MMLLLVGKTLRLRRRRWLGVGLVAISKAQPTRTVTEILTLLRIDRLQVKLPQPTKADARSAGSLQERLGGTFGKVPGLNDVFNS